VRGKRTWGFTPQEWDRARCALERLLADAALRRCTVTYGEVARTALGGRVSARSGALMDLLGDVDRQAERDRGVIIASLVVRADTGMPGEGYFLFVEDELGRPVPDRRVFWEHEVERVWESYASDTGAAE